MAVTAFLCGFGFGNLGDEACLATAFRLFKTSTNCVFTHDSKVTEKVAKFDLYFSDLGELLSRYPKIDRVVVAGGGVGFNPSFKDNLDWAYHCKQRGAEVLVHNIGIGKIGAQWADNWPYLVPVLKEAREFSVRDYRSSAEVISWNLGLRPTISFYPERHLPIDSKLSDIFPYEQNRKVIGISMNTRPELWHVLHDNLGVMGNILESFGDYVVLPIVSTIHAIDAAERDDLGFEQFVRLFGLEKRVIFPQVAETSFWRENIGPRDIKFLISQCDFLISARKHNIVHAIGAKTPFIGVFEFDNDSISRVYQTLFPYLPRGSSLLPLYPQ